MAVQAERALGLEEWEVTECTDGQGGGYCRCVELEKLLRAEPRVDVGMALGSRPGIEA